MDFGKHGSMREIEQTDLRSILLFMLEYPKWKASPTAGTRVKTLYADQVDWL
jgi:hypothetical protein